MAIVSPHLDDAVLSLGSAIHRAARAGARVTVVTVLAGDPRSSMPAGPWDARAGFATAGEATVARRREDERACALVGAFPVWLPFFGGDYPATSDDDVWAALEGELDGADAVAVPTWPLTHPDHLSVYELVHSRSSARLIGYVEAPYARWAGEPLGTGFSELRPDRASREAKSAALESYATQIPLLTGDPSSFIDREARASEWTRPLDRSSRKDVPV